MNRSCRRACFFLLAPLLFACNSGARAPAHLNGAQATLQTRVNKAQATLADTIRFEIVLKHDPQLSLEIPEVGDQIHGFRIVGDGRSPAKKEEGKIISTRWYDLKADLVGSYQLPALRLAYAAAEGEKTVEAPSIFVEVKTEAPSEKGAAGENTEEGLRDIKPLVESGWTKRDWGLKVLLPLGVLAALAVLVYLLKRWSNRTTIGDAPLSADAWAVKALEELKIQSKSLDVKNLESRKRYYFRLSEIFREYVERRFGFPARDLTTEEILPFLKKRPEISPRGREGAQRFLADTDFVKFTDLSPAADNPQVVWDAAWEFVQGTRPRLPEGEAA